MKLSKLQLTNFRNHKKLVLDFDDISSLIIGPNGAGKSNILEAIQLISTTKSLRTKYDRELIAHTEQFAKITALAQINGDKTELELNIIKSEKFQNASSKKAKINKVAKSLSAFTGNLNSVLFTPRDLELFTGSPTLRRKYIDSVFFQIDKKYKKAHAQYTKAIRQRNKILELIRDEGRGTNQLGFWSEKVIETGQELQVKRQGFFEFVQTNISRYGDELNGRDVVCKINYKKSNLSESELERRRDAEIATKTTLVGPHRDDFSIEFDGFDLATFGSRGQKRSNLLALKLCEIDFITKRLNRRPILLLDDIFSELDAQHKEAVLNIIDLQQTIVTSTENQDFTHALKRITL